ncbi:hypothetical protein RSAG8_12759, partial [Rhizoctonia solani AG-8 WAC10335]
MLRSTFVQRAPLRGGLTLRARLQSRAMSTPALQVTPPSAAQENELHGARVKDIEEYFASPRFNGIKRSYTAESVVTKQGSLPPLPLPSSLLSDKFHSLLKSASEEGRPLHTMGAIDPVQMTQMAKHQEVLYVSGWAASSVLTTGNNEVGPDLGDYPYTTVPNQVHRLFRAQQLHDRKHYDERMSLHSTAMVTAELAERYKRDGMLAYVELIQRREKELGVDVLTHQKWSGAPYIDRILSTISSGSSSTSGMGKDSTEHTF